MPYSELMVRPMREDLTRLGVKELRTVAEVDEAMANPPRTMLLFVNSVCGCAAGAARPALALAIRQGLKPDAMYTVFAGQDLDATARARSYFSEYEPSSPSIVLFRDGEVAHFVHRHMIEGRTAEAIATDLILSFRRVAEEESAQRPD